MHNLKSRIRAPRAGFTLVEMLAVLAIILLLATLSVYFVPSINDRQRASTGADRTQLWALISKQRAKKDKVVTGIRLLPGAAQANPILRPYNPSLIYVQQLDAYTTPGRRIRLDGPTNLEPPPPPPNGRPPYGPTGQPSQAPAAPPYYIATLENGVGADFTSGANTLSGSNQLDPNTYPVQPGDFLELPVGGQQFRIWNVPSATKLQLELVTLLTSTGQGVLSGGSASKIGNIDPLTGPVYYLPYRIVRGVRPLAGEAVLQLPLNIAVDTNMNTIYGSPLPSYNSDGTLDILFAPDGSVANRAGCADKIFLWIRDITKNVPDPKSPIGSTFDPGSPGGIVSIDTRTGFIASFQVAAGVDTTTSTKLLAGTNNVQLAVANSQGIQAENYLILEPYTNPESVKVINVPTIGLVLERVTRDHPAGARVILDPFGFARDPRKSGL